MPQTRLKLKQVTLALAALPFAIGLALAEEPAKKGLSLIHI